MRRIGRNEGASGRIILGLWRWVIRYLASFFNYFCTISCSSKPVSTYHSSNTLPSHFPPYSQCCNHLQTKAPSKAAPTQPYYYHHSPTNSLLNSQLSSSSHKSSPVASNGHIISPPLSPNAHKFPLAFSTLCFSNISQQPPPLSQVMRFREANHKR